MSSQEDLQYDDLLDMRKGILVACGENACLDQIAHLDLRSPLTESLYKWNIFRQQIVG